jgi:RimJ/RimL family protein N-acetyltransferase
MLEACRSQPAVTNSFHVQEILCGTLARTTASACDEAAPLHWQPRDPPLIVVDDSFVLDRWRPADGPALRRFDLDPVTARFFGYSVEQAAALPDSHYDGDTRTRGSLQAWREGRQLNLAIRRSSDGEAVGWVELQRAGEQAEVSYNVTAELRGQGIAPRALSALLVWAASQIGLRRAHLACHVDNVASRRVAEKCGFVLVSQGGDEYKFERGLGLPDGPALPPTARPAS